MAILDKVITGKIKTAQKVVIYGPEGIGKSTFASKFPKPLFIDTEGSTTHMDVTRTPKLTSWTMLIEIVKEVRNTPHVCETLVIDTADWAEILCSNFICSRAQVKGIEDFGYGKGYTYLEEEFGKMLNLLQDVVDVGINIVITAHAQMRKFEQPDELGSYDRWELKLEKKTSALVKEWADMVLFANYKTYVVNVDNQGAAKGKNKAQGGSRVMYTTHHPCWDAKNRHNLPAEIPFDYSSIENVFEKIVTPVQQQASIKLPSATSSQSSVDLPNRMSTEVENKSTLSDAIPRELHDLMEAYEVTEEEIQKAVAKRGYFPVNTPIANYGESFIKGKLIAAWPQVYQVIKEISLPFDL